MNGSGPLYDELHRRFEEAAEPQPVHRFLARSPPLLRERGAPHQLIVSTRYDLALERAFERPGEEVDVVTYVATGPYRGKFWHRAPGEEPRPIDVPEHIRDRALARPPHRSPQAARRRRPVPGARVGELRDHRGRLHRLPRSLGRRVVGARCAGRAPAAEPFPVHRLRDGRLEPAARHAPRLGRPTARVPLLGGRPRADAARAAFWRRFEVDVLDVDPDDYVELLARRLEGAA